MKNMIANFARLPMPLKMGAGALVVFVVGAVVYKLGGAGNAWITLGVFIGVGLLLGAIGWFAKMRSAKKSADLEKALGEDGPDSGLGDESERRERQEVRQQWTKAIEETRNAGFSLYTLPWYLLIGEPAGGKSTTLRASGLEFPVGAEAISGLGGTKNCDWWFTNEGVILDTAGRFTFEEKNAPDAAGWSEFLQLIQRSRPRCPINGCIVAIPCTSLLSDDPDTIEAKATSIRSKLQELEQSLAIQFPVYVLVTKSDKILGFTEFFSRLPALEQRQLFGWSKPGDYREVFPSEKWGEVFGDLRQQLTKWRGQFLDDDSDAGDVDRLYAFPDEFATIEQPLAHYLSRMFSDNRYVDPLFLRGVYFTSGIQKGAPIVSACANLLRNATQGTDEQLLEKLYAKSRAFFIRDFYRKKVFKEQGLIQPTRLAMRRKQLVERVGYTTLGVLSIALLAFLIYGGAKVGRDSTAHRDSLQAMKEAVDERKPVLAATKLVGENTRDLHRDGLAPWGMSMLFGGQAQESVAQHISAAEVELFSQGALKPLGRKLAEAFDRTPKTWAEYVAYEKAAHRYLAFHIGLPDPEASEDATTVTLEAAGLAPEYLESIEPFLSFVDEPQREEFEAAFQDLRETASLTGVRPDYRSAFPLEEADADRMLGGLQEFWRNATVPGLQDYGDAEIPEFQDWRTWCELVHLSEGMDEKIQSRAFELERKGTFEEDRDRLAEWASAVGIENDRVDTLLDSARRIEAIFSARTAPAVGDSASAGDGAAPGTAQAPRFDLMHFDDLVKALRRRVDAAFEPFLQAKIATPEYSLASDARRYHEQTVDAFDSAPRKLGPRANAQNAQSLYAAFSVTGGRGEVTLTMEPAFQEISRILQLIETAITQSRALHDPQPGSADLESWRALPAWLDGGREKLGVSIEAKGRERNESLRAVAKYSRVAQQLAESVWVTRSCEALRRAALEEEGYALMNQFALERAPKFEDGRGFEFRKPEGLDSKATFGPAAVEVLTFADRLLSYRRSEDGDPLLYTEEGDDFDDALGGFVRRYFTEYRKRWDRALEMTQTAIAQGRAPTDAPATLDELETPDRLKEVLIELRQHIGFAAPDGLDRSLTRKSLDILDEDLGRFRASYPLPEGGQGSDDGGSKEGDRDSRRRDSEESDEAAPTDRIEALTKLLEEQRSAHATLEGAWGAKEESYPIFALFEAASGGGPSMWEQLTGPGRYLQEQRMDDSVSKALLDRSIARSTEVEHWIVDAFNQRFEKWSDANSLERHKRSFPFLAVQGLESDSPDIDRFEFQELWEEAAAFRKIWKSLITADTDSEAAAGFSAFAEPAVAERIEFLNRLVVFGEFTKAGETNRNVEYRLTPDVGQPFERHLNELYSTVTFELGSKVGPTLLDGNAFGGWDAQAIKWDFEDHPTLRLEFTGTKTRNPDPLVWPAPDTHPTKWKSWLALPRFLYKFAENPIGSSPRQTLDDRVVVRQDSALMARDGSSEADYSIRYLFDFSRKVLAAQPTISRRLLRKADVKSQNPRER